MQGYAITKKVAILALMNNGFLSQYFESVGAKKLSEVEVNPAKSNQHEFNGSRELKDVLRTTEKTVFPTKFIWIEEQNEALSEEGTVTWYDARESHATRTEFRLYFPSNPITEMAKAGDTMFIARRTDNSLLIVLTSSGSTIESQLYWLFGLEIPTDSRFSTIEFNAANDHEIDFATRFIMDELGIELEEPENDYIDGLLKPFLGSFPSTIEFSAFARQTFRIPIDMIDDPDGSLLALMDWEEKLFRRLERYVVARRLNEGFFKDEEEDVEGFLSFSLSVQNRRKVRAGYALEDHLTQILLSNHVTFSKKQETENKAKPDFIFPSAEAYRDMSFPSFALTILGTKTSCKDRWRQVLTEARRVDEKHLLTLEPGISVNQTNEMRAHNLQLIIPKMLHKSFTIEQQTWLLDVKTFIRLIENKQIKSHSASGRLFS